MAKLTGQTLLGRYRIQNSIGRGGMAEVYKAWDSRRNYDVAIKVLRADLANNPHILRSFESEAQLLASLAHANIVRFYNFEHKGSLAFIVMDYVEGTTLSQHIQAARGHPLALKTVNSVVEQVSAALHFAHTEGVIHRDVKPSNIMLCPDDKVLLSDFGIAQAIGSGASGRLEGGSPAYMSPEQFRGASLDARTDLYALGIVIYEMLAGRKPFCGDTPKTTGRPRDKIRWEHLHAEPPPLRRFNPAVPEGIIWLIVRLLAKDPAARPATALAVLHQWQAAIAAQPAARQVERSGVIREPLPSVPGSDRKMPLQPSPAGQRRLRLDRRVVAMSVAALVVIVIVGALVTNLGTRQISGTVTNTRRGISPGLVQIERCFNHEVAVDIELIFCVQQVAVNLDGTLKFDVSWMGQYGDETYQIKKGSDAGNRNMYLTDNLGRRYDHVEAGGAAAREVVLSHRQAAYGWFLFPAPAAGATTFTFHDDDLGQTIEGINLSP